MIEILETNYTIRMSHKEFAVLQKALKNAQFCVSGIAHNFEPWEYKLWLEIADTIMNGGDETK